MKTKSTLERKKYMAKWYLKRKKEAIKSGKCAYCKKGKRVGRGSRCQKCNDEMNARLWSNTHNTPYVPRRLLTKEARAMILQADKLAQKIYFFRSSDEPPVEVLYLKHPESDDMKEFLEFQAESGMKLENVFTIIPLNGCSLPRSGWPYTAE